MTPTLARRHEKRTGALTRLLVGLLWLGLIAAGLAGAPALTAANVIRGPYLQNGTPTSVTVCWRTDVATNSRVTVGTTAGSLTTQTNNAAVVTDHEIVVSGLTAGTKYYYEVGSSSAVLAGNTANHWFVTLPAAGTSKPVRVWAIGDAGTGTAQQAQVRDAYLTYTGIRNTDVWLMLGDNAYNTGTDAEYQTNVFNVYANPMRNTLLWSTRGNHDQSASVYYGIFAMPTAAEAGGTASGTEAYYSFDYGRVHFVCLDSESSSNAPGSPMLTWLANDLNATAMDWIVAYWHRPPYTKGSHDSDTEADLVAIRTNILPVLESGGVDLVLCGHSHSYERSFFIDGHYGLSGTFTNAMKVQTGDGRVAGNGAYTKTALGTTAHAGAVYTVAGSSGKTETGPLNHPAMFLSVESLGSVVLDIYGNHLDAVFLNESGTVIDNFRILKDASGNDTTNPVIAAAAAVTTTRIDVVFSENVTSATANTAANYTLTGVLGNVTVSAAALQPDGKTVRLTVTTLAAGAAYTLTVANVRDPSNNAVPGGSPVTILAPGSAGAAPAITTAPTAQIVTVGQTATFSVVASGAATLTYQWQKNNANIPAGAAASSYTTPGTVIGDNGAQYRVIIKNAYGTATSTNVTLTVNAASNPVSVNSSTLTYSAPTGSTTPVSKTLTLTNTTGSSITVTLGSSAGWLTTAPTPTVVVGALGSTTITVTIDPTGQTGTLNGTLTLTNAPGGQVRTVPITLTITTATGGAGAGKKGGCAVAADGDAMALWLSVILAGVAMAMARGPRRLCVG